MKGFSYRTLTLTVDSEKTQRKDRHKDSGSGYVCVERGSNKMWVREQRAKKVWPGLGFHCPVSQIKRVCDLECFLEEPPSCFTSPQTE